MSEDLASAWPLRVRLSDIRGEGTTRTLAAEPEQRLAIARVLDLLAVEAFTAAVRLSPWRDGVQVDATWSATVTRACSLTLESFGSALSGDFAVRLAPPAAAQDLDSPEEIVLDLEADDPPDALDGDAVALGSLLVEHLALELEPFPRAPGARFEPPPEPAEPSPFAALARLARPSD